MKKLFFLPLIVGLLFTSCKKDEPVVDEGTVRLDVTTQSMTYGQSFKITPIFSATGAVRNRTFEFTSSADSIAGVKLVTGGLGEVTAKRVGDATIYYKSSDGKYNLSCKVNVTPRTTLLNGIYYLKDASKTDIQSKIPTYCELDQTLTTSTLLVYNNTGAPTLKMKKLIFEMTTDGKLKSTNVILENTTDNQLDADSFIRERYLETNRAKNGITYYNAGVSTDYARNTFVGIFTTNTSLISGQDVGLGVKFIDNAYLNL